MYKARYLPTDLVRHIFHPPCALATAGPGSELLQVTEHVLVLGSDHRDPSASSSLYLTPSQHHTMVPDLQAELCKSTNVHTASAWRPLRRSVCWPVPGSHTRHQTISTETRGQWYLSAMIFLSPSWFMENIDKWNRCHGYWSRYMSCSLSCIVTKLTKYDILLIHLQFQWSEFSSLFDNEPAWKAWGCESCLICLNLSLLFLYLLDCLILLIFLGLLIC